MQQLLLDDDDDDALLSLPFCAADDAALLFSLNIIIRPCPGGRCSIVLHLLGQLQWSASSLCFPKPPFFSCCSCGADDLLLLLAAAAAMAASRAVKGEVSISAAAIVVEKSMFVLISSR